LIRALLLLLVASPAFADAPEEAARAQSFAGVWQFDRNRSDSTKPMLEALDVPWFARMAMSRFAPKMTIRGEGDGLHIVTTSPVGDDRVRSMPCDGSETSGEDQLGRSFTETTRWQEDGSMLLQRQVELGARTVRIQGTWRRSGDDLEIQTVVRGADGMPFEIRRVFRPVREEAS
jgi:hypothetical protein